MFGKTDPGEFGHSADSTVPEFLDLDLIDESDESRFGEFGHSADPSDSGPVGLLENLPSDSRFDSSGSLNTRRRGKLSLGR